MASHGTRFFELQISSAMATSGMRLRNERLTAPMAALKPNKRANCHGRVVPARQAAETKKVTKLPELCTPASRARYLPRKAGGTSTVIQGSQALLEMPRETL